jgi:hypothetical protein
MAGENTKGAGAYRVNDTDFPVPVTSWDEQPIAAGLNGIPVLSSYRIHSWRWDQLESHWAELLYSLFNTQQAGNAQLDSIETDPYDATGANLDYGTEIYTDAIIQSVGARTRGFPMYDDVTVTFEVYVS